MVSARFKWQNAWIFRGSPIRERGVLQVEANRVSINAGIESFFAREDLPTGKFKWQSRMLQPITRINLPW